MHIVVALGLANSAANTALESSFSVMCRLLVFFQLLSRCERFRALLLTTLKAADLRGVLAVVMLLKVC